ncbi:Outer membrane protein transport protein [Sulfidibacter corallicola]|uniref:Outer membrane protein transport protein n=1 Tax=Sulfidibacter corallicola TaxID=2818388 RepID=A0A8A4TVG9_SULCO|nr:outer membrane protein transport protein [Sulfidibacter corallicola]QTD53510.1 outer membrane protein transport protein [Sulfidibacter corallicola]
MGKGQMIQGFKVTMLTIACMALTATPAWASGFGVYEQGVQSSGMAGAYVARAEDASAVYHNPAGLAQLPFQELAFSVRPAASKSFYSNAGQTTYDSDPTFSALPSIFWNSPSFGRFAFGIGTTASHHYELDWEEADYPGRFLSTGSEFYAQDLLAGFAVKLAPAWSFGITYRYTQAEYRIDRNLARPIGELGNPVFYEASESSDVDGDGTGYIVGLQYYPSRKFSIGFSYQSAIDLNMDGDRTFAQATRLDDQRAITDFGGAFNDTTLATSLELPQRYQVGFATRVTIRTRVEFDLSLEDWSSVDQQVFVAADGSNMVIPRNWDETWSYRLAGDFQQKKALLWRAGLAATRRVMPTDTVEPGFPDGDRFSYHFGVSYTYKRRYILEGAVIYVQNRDRKVSDLELITVDVPPDFVQSTGEQGAFETQRWQANFGLRIRWGVPKE